MSEGILCFLFPFTFMLNCHLVKTVFFSRFIGVTHGKSSQKRTAVQPRSLLTLRAHSVLTMPPLPVSDQATVLSSSSRRIPRLCGGRDAFEDGRTITWR